MVNQNVNQNTPGVSFEDIFESPYNGTNPRDFSRQFGQEQQDAFLSHPQGLQPSAAEPELDAPKNLILTTQSVSVADRDTDTSIRTGSFPDEASTAPTPTSSEEVSGMPKPGNGCIFEFTNRSGKVVWKVDITVGKNFSGNRKRIRRTAKTYEDALKLQRAMWFEQDQGTLGTTSKSTFEAYAEWWLENVSALTVRTSTLADYRSRLKLNAYPAFGHRRITDITSKDLQEWLVSLRKQTKSTSTINGARQVVGMVLAYAFDNGDIAKNPAKTVRKLVKLQDEPTRVQDPWTADEARSILELARGTSMDLFVHFGVMFGLRRGEILGLQWPDFNFEEGWVSIKRGLKEQSTLGPDGKNHTTLVTNATKNQSSTRKLYLPPALLAAIQRQREYVAGLREIAGEGWTESPHVFVSAVGTPIFPTNMTKAFTRFLKNNNLRHIRVHDMRHSAAVLSLTAGVRIESVSQGLGHTRIDTTKGVYAPLVQSLNDEFTRGLAEWLVPDTQLNEINTEQKEKSPWPTKTSTS